MVNLSELRLGNLLQHKEQICTVTGISAAHVEVRNPEKADVVSDLRSLAPIPLNPEWMQRYSGNESGYLTLSQSERESGSSDIRILSTVECYLHEDGALRISAYEYERYPGSSSAVPEDVITLGYRHIRYVHQLQNLYYLLSGEELTAQAGIL